MTASKSQVFRFADVEVREREFSLTKAGEVLPVEPKAFRVLLILLRNPQKLLPAAGVLAVCLLGAFWYLHRPLPPPRITAYTQITGDHRAKLLAGTDGSRLYFTLQSPVSIAQISATGGEIAPVPVAVPGYTPTLWGVSPDGSSFLVAAQLGGDPTWAVWNVPVLGGSPRRLTNALDATFSPDGNTVAYSTPDGDIWKIRSDGSGAQKLGPAGGRAYNLSWSPNGMALRFDRGERLWEMSSSGSNLHELLPGLPEGSSQCCGEWTPDGNFFFFLAHDSPISTSQIWALDERHGFLRKPPAKPIQLTSSPISWSYLIAAKDGRKIFATGETPRGELSRYDATTKRFEPFLGSISADSVSFSRDGKSMAYVSFPEGILWKANRDGSNPVRLTDPPMYPLNPSWSPDGTQILFTDMFLAMPKSFIVPSEGGIPRPLSLVKNGKLADPTWSADGHQVVFAAGELRDPDKEDLRSLDLASGHIAILPASAGRFSPRWSWDGRYIPTLAFDDPILRVFDVQKQRWLAMATKGSVDFPSWSRDSRFIYFLRYGHDQGVFRIKVPDGQEEHLVDLKDLHITGLIGFWMGLDPTDAPLLLRDTGASDIYALTLEEK